MSDPHQITMFLPILVSIFASLCGAAIAIFASAQAARRQEAKAFDFVASARRIRAGRPRSGRGA